MPYAHKSCYTSRVVLLLNFIHNDCFFQVQIRPWYISDSQYSIGNKSVELDSRKAVFVGGVPRPLKAIELAEVMTEKYGNVAYVAIDCDSDLKYPKGTHCHSIIMQIAYTFLHLSFCFSSNSTCNSCFQYVL